MCDVRSQRSGGTVAGHYVGGWVMTGWNGAGMSVMAALKPNARNRCGCAPPFARRFCELGSGCAHRGLYSSALDDSDG